MKKLLLIAILLCCTQIFAQKTFEVEKILYQQKYEDSFWSYVIVKDINTTVCYSRDTLFVEFPQKEFYISSISSNVKLYYDEDSISITHIFLCADTKEKESCNIECIWKDNILYKVIIIKLNTKIEYIIKQT